MLVPTIIAVGAAVLGVAGFLAYAAMVLRFLGKAYDRAGDRRDLAAAGQAIRAAGLAFPAVRRGLGELDRPPRR